MSREIAIDMGTHNTVIFMKGQGASQGGGIALREPSVVAVDSRSDEILAAGKEAKDMAGKSAGGVKIIKPMRGGAVADFDVMAAMLRTFIKRAIKSANISRPRVVIGVPADATQVEKTAAEDVVKHAGCGDVTLLEAPLAIILGAGLSPASPRGIMTIDLGAGHTEVSVAALGEIIATRSERFGSARIDEGILRYIKKKYNLQIGDLTAEDIKVKIGSAFPQDDSFSSFMEVRGRSVTDNLPKSITIHADEIRTAISGILEDLTALIARTTEELPPEIASDILESGIIMSGGGAMLKGLDKFIEETTGLKVTMTERPFDTLAEGLGKSLEVGTA